jgi:ParB family chromosome partitioning protein
MIEALPVTAAMGRPPPEALGHAGEVGGDVVVLHGEELAGAGEAGLHLVGDEHDAVVVAQGPEGAHEVGGGLVEAALALHGLEDDRGDAGGVEVGLEELGDAGERVLGGGAVEGDREGTWKTSGIMAPKPAL